MVSFKCERLATFYCRIEGGLLEWESSGLTLEVTPMFSQGSGTDIVPMGYTIPVLGLRTVAISL